MGRQKHKPVSETEILRYPTPAPSRMPSVPGDGPAVEKGTDAKTRKERGVEPDSLAAFIQRLPTPERLDTEDHASSETATTAATTTHAEPAEEAGGGRRCEICHGAPGGSRLTCTSNGCPRGQSHRFCLACDEDHCRHIEYHVFCSGLAARPEKE